jgi:hypothetical protein
VNDVPTRSNPNAEVAVHTTRPIGLLRCLTTAAIASLLLAPSAIAHIPGVGNGLGPSTNGPDLRSVQALASDLDDGLPEQARFCFDANVANVVEGPADAVFALHAYDATRAMRPTNASRDTTDATCAIASFAPGTDVTQATVGTVFPGAVTDLQSRTNTLASEPVEGSVHTATPGSTTAPDLLGVTVNASEAGHKRATYLFDETLDRAPTAPYEASRFGFYNATDTPVSAPAGPVSISGRSATVDFLTTPNLETATRFFINPGAVQDRPQTTTYGGVPVATAASPDVLSRGPVSVARVEMISATPIGAQDVKVAFNVPVQFTPASAAGFFAISDAAVSPVAASAVGSGGAPNEVVVTFPAALADDPGSIVRIYLAPATVTAVGGAATNLAGQAAMSTAHSVPGFTNGPDLLSVSVNALTSRVTYTYDERVQDTPPPAAAALTAAAVDGSPIAAVGGVVVSGSTVTALFGPALGSAVMFSNPYATVFDKTGVPNPAQSVSTELQQAPAVPPPPPAAAPPPPPPAPVVAATKYRTRVTIHSRGRLYFGTVSSARDRCRRGRRVLLKRNGLKYASAISARKGTYRIKRKHRLRGLVYVTVTARGVCRTAKSRKIHG